MKRKNLLLMAMSGMLLSLNAQAQPAIGWSKIYGGNGGDIAYSVKPTPDGGYIAAGSTMSGISGDVSDRIANKEPDFWVVKLNDTGKIEWEKVYGGYAGSRAYKVINTKDGGYAIIGDIMGDGGDVTQYIGHHDLWVIKLDKSGTIEWDQAIGGGDQDGVGDKYSGDIQETADGGFIIGTTMNTYGMTGIGNNSDDIVITKLNAKGDKEWEKIYGSTETDWLGSVFQTADGGFFVSGMVSKADGDVTGPSKGESDWWALKLDDTGRIEWNKVLGGSRGEFPAKATLAEDGGYVLAGISRSNDGDVVRSSPWANMWDDNIWVVKIDQTGQNIVWNKAFGGTMTEDAINITKTNDGGAIISGMTSSSDYGMPGDYATKDNDGFMIKIDADGNQEWAQAYGSSKQDYIYEVYAMADGGYVAAGYASGQDYDIPQHDFGGEKLWILKLEAPAMDSLVVATKNNVPATITTNGGTLDLAATIYPRILPQDVIWSIVPGTGTATIDANGIVTAQTDGTVWGKAVAANNNAFADSIEITISGQTVDPEDPERVANLGANLPVRIYPNPAANTINLQLNTAHPEMTISIINIDGKLVFQQNVGANSLSNAMQINIASFPAGVYHVRLEGDNVQAGTTVIKQ